MQILDPGAVELDELRRHVGELEQPGLPGAEVVERDADVQLLEIRSQGLQRWHVGDCGLMDLEGQIARRMTLAQAVE